MKYKNLSHPSDYSIISQQNYTQTTEHAAVYNRYITRWKNRPKKDTEQENLRKCQQERKMEALQRCD